METAMVARFSSVWLVSRRNVSKGSASCVDVAATRGDSSRQFIVIVDVLRIVVQWCPVRTGCICILRTIGSEINKQCRATRPVLIDRNSFWISPSFFPVFNYHPQPFLFHQPNVERSLSFVSFLNFLSCLKKLKTSVFPLKEQAIGSFFRCVTVLCVSVSIRFFLPCFFWSSHISTASFSTRPQVDLR